VEVSTDEENLILQSREPDTFENEVVPGRPFNSTVKTLNMSGTGAGELSFLQEMIETSINRENNLLIVNIKQRNGLNRYNGNI
jgi:hypothetical protein